MLQKIKYILPCLAIIISTVQVYAQPSTKYKCMLQLNNYTGEGAYIVVLLINKNDEYEKTLYVLGDDKKWYPDLKA